ncbi:MAG TPA: hypothetical protein VI277_06670, partial [Candidatus Limnocylindria bacterium]
MRTRAMALAGVATLMLLVAVAATWFRVATPSDGTRAEYLSGAFTSDGLRVAPIPGVASSLRPGDLVTAIEGVALDDWLTRDANADAPQPGFESSVEYAVMRDGAAQHVEVRLGQYPFLDVILEAWGTLLQCAAMLAVATYIMVRRPEAVGAGPLLMFAAGLTGSTVPWLLGLQSLDVVGPLGFWIWAGGVFLVYSLMWSALVHFGLVFPRRLALARSRLTIPLVYGVPLAVVVGTLVVSTAASGSLLGAFGSATAIQLVLVIAAGIAALTLVAFQLRTAPTDQARDQVRWIAWAGGISLALSLGLWFIPELITGRPLLPWSAVGAAGLVFPVAIVAAVMRHRLFDIDIVINRSLVYGGLTVAVVTIYGVVAAGLGALFRGDGGFAASLVATGAAALGALPVRDRLQRAVNRLMYGDRDEPHRAINRLADRLNASLATEEVLPTVVATVASAMRLPYVAIELQQDGRRTIVAETGTSAGDGATRLPLVDEGEVVGELIAAPRSPGERFDSADQALLASLAR